MCLLTPLPWLVVLGLSVPLTGTVEDRAGRPVAGATVWLGDTFLTRDWPEVIATAETDEQGRFRLERPEKLAGRNASWSPTLWAYKPGASIAFVEFKKKIPAADEPVRLRLGPPASTSLRVLKADGSLARGAKVQLVRTNWKAPNPPDGMLDRLSSRADDQGRATIDGMAPGDISSVDVTLEGQIVQCLPIDADAGTVTLRPLGRLKARIVADDPKALKGWDITVWPRPTEAGYKGPYTTQWARETTGDDGRVEFPPLSEGAVVWTIKPPEGSSYLVSKLPGIAIKPGEPAEATIEIRKGVRVEGVVLEDPSGAPLPGIKVDLMPLKSPGSPTTRNVTTDAEGRFSDVVLPGTIRFSFSPFQMPKEYFLPPNIQHWLDFEVPEGPERHDFTPPRLRKAALVKGKVLDQQGRPAPGISVSYRWFSDEFGQNPNTEKADTDPNGEFVLGHIAPGAHVTITAASGPANESETAIVNLAGEGGTITLGLKSRPTLALSGRVFDSDGKPLAQASIQVRHRLTTAHGSDPGQLFAFEADKPVLTGSDGRFQTPSGLPLDEEYRVEAEAPGYEPSRSKWVKAPKLGVPDLKLKRAIAIRTVSGRVVDSSGKPVAGVEVYQSGDGPKLTRGLTDDDGRFQVAGVPDAPAFLFASKTGYRFLGQRVESGDRLVDFSLRRLDEPPASILKRAGPAIGREEERTIALGLLDDARKAPGTDFEIPERAQILVATAMVDPYKAAEVAQALGRQSNIEMLAALVVGRYEVDPRRSLAMIEAIELPDLAGSVALSVFDQMGSAAPIGYRANLLDLDAVRRACESEPPAQAAYLMARLADRWLDLGELERGSRIALEAQRLAALPQKPGVFDPWAEVAIALARVDLPASLKLLEGRVVQQPWEIDNPRAQVAKRIAADHPVEARKLVELIEERSRPAARRDVCLAMASKNIQAARTLAAEDHDPLVEALLPAIAAKAKEKTEPGAARALLLESVEMLAKLEQGDGQPSTAVALASLLPMASRIDPDRAPGYLWLAISKRPPLPSLPEPMPVMPQVRQRYLERIELAVLVARYDRGAAEAIFEPVARRLPGLDDDYWGLGGEGSKLYRMAGIFDARRARKLLEALPEDPPPPANENENNNFRHHSKAVARIALAKILATPPELRLLQFSQPFGQPDWLAILDEQP